jgi:hypothetical protein
MEVLYARCCALLTGLAPSHHRDFATAHARRLVTSRRSWIVGSQTRLTASYGQHMRGRDADMPYQP